ncbi:MAG: TldD/PmbA family protein [Aigarchaeota archaeon]|nr:TldD/PmbA family protein [Candidatus Pelearchaeum maunauluense]
METRKMASRLIREARRLGATDAAVMIDSGIRRIIRYANNEITVTKTFNNTSVMLYVCIKERRAVASTTDTSSQALKRMVEKAVYMAKNSPPADVYSPLPRGPYKYDKRLLKPGEVSGEPDELVKHVESTINGALNAGATRVAGTLVYDDNKTYLRTTGGVEAIEHSRGIEISTRAFVSDDATGHFVSIAAAERLFNPYEAGYRAGEIAKMAANPVSGEPGVYEALIGPMTFANLVEELGEAASAFHVDAGISFLTEKLGQEVASSHLTLIDDPTLAETYGARAFDDEGVPTRRNTIIENGVLKTYLHNSTTAKKFNTQTTANAGIIVPHPFNLVVEQGSKSLDKLISSIDNGIWITNDWYLRYQNHRTGDFSTIPRDGLFLIKHGSIEKSLKELRLSDNMLKLFSKIRDIGNERYWISWWEVETPVLAPAVVVEEANFTKSAL